MEAKPTETANSSERSSKLPDELLQAQASRSEALKWKLVLVAGLGAAGLGVGETDASLHSLKSLLALIPFVCIYADLLCTDLKVRIFIIGTYYAEIRNDTYERFVHRNRHFFWMEDLAMHLSTYWICFILVAVGLFSRAVSESTEFPPDPSTVQSTVTASVLQNKQKSASADAISTQSKPARPPIPASTSPATDTLTSLGVGAAVALMMSRRHQLLIVVLEVLFGGLFILQLCLHQNLPWSPEDILLIMSGIAGYGVSLWTSDQYKKDIDQLVLDADGRFHRIPQAIQEPDHKSS